MMKKSMIILLLALLLCFCTAAAENTEILGQAVPDFTAEDTEGNTFSLSEALKDHEAVLINIWATWCPPCRQEFPDLNEAYEQYKDRVAFIALSSERNDTLSVIADFRTENGITFPMGRESGTGLVSYLGASSIPTTVIVDRFGKAAYMQMGRFSSAAEVKRLLEVFLGEGYTETKVLDRIPRDTSTRAYPVSASRMIKVENEGARRILLQAEGVIDDTPAYVINEDKVRLRFGLRAEDDALAITYYDGTDGSMHDMLSLADKERNTYVYEQSLPGAQDEYPFTYGVFYNQEDDMDPYAVQYLFIAGEESIEGLVDYFRSEGVDVTWKYEEEAPVQEAAADAYTVHVTDQDGRPVPGVMVNFCTDTACTTLISDQNGVITQGGAPENYHVQLLKVPEGYSYDQGFEMYTGIAFGEWTLRICRD